MKVAVTGGTGFIGNYVVSELLQRGIAVTVIGSSLSKAQGREWFGDVEFLEIDIHKQYPAAVMQKIAASDKMIHLAWQGLPNYKDLFHFESNLPAQYFFLKELITLGLQDIVITGTCFEYGMKEGALDTGMFADPANPYALAKDTLRKFLQEFQKIKSFRLKWLRLFYMYGKGQSEKSILSLLQKALDNGDESFNMSGGEQIRDYLPVEKVAEYIVNHCLDQNNGIYNVCSGIPVSIKSLVENYLEKQGRHIKLNLGFYPYPDYEPMEFWGVK